MRYIVEYDNEDNAEEVALEPSDVPLLGTDPETVMDGHVAVYEFPDDTDEADIEAALEQSNWCFTAMSREDAAPTP